MMTSKKDDLIRRLKAGKPDPSLVLEVLELVERLNDDGDAVYESLMANPDLILGLPDSDKPRALKAITAYTARQQAEATAFQNRVSRGKGLEAKLTPVNFAEFGDHRVLPQLRYPVGYNEQSREFVYKTSDVAVFMDSFPADTQQNHLVRDGAVTRGPVVPSGPLLYALSLRAMRDRTSNAVANDIFQLLRTAYRQAGLWTASRPTYPSSGSDRVRHNALHTDKTPLGAEWGVSAPLAGVSGEYISRVRDAPLVLRTLLGAESVAEVNELSQAYVDRATRLWRDQTKPNQGSVERGLWVGFDLSFDVNASDDVDNLQAPALRVMERA